MSIPEGWQANSSDRFPYGGVGWLSLPVKLVDGLEHDLADNLHAAGAQLIERVVGGMPRLVVQIENIDRRDSGIDERNVVVFVGSGTVLKVILVAEPFRD